MGEELSGDVHLGYSQGVLIMDVRYAVRRLRSRPTYALLAILTLAIGVGGTAAAFGLVRGLSLAGATLALMIVGVAAALLPAWRASRLDPAAVFREG